MINLSYVALPLGVRYQHEESGFPQQTRYGWSRSADLMFVQHVLASLTPDGVGVMVVPNGVLFRGGAEPESTDQRVMIMRGMPAG